MAQLTSKEEEGLTSWALKGQFGERMCGHLPFLGTSLGCSCSCSGCRYSSCISDTSPVAASQASKDRIII